MPVALKHPDTVDFTTTTGQPFVINFDNATVGQFFNGEDMQDWTIPANEDEPQTVSVEAQSDSTNFTFSDASNPKLTSASALFTFA
jgi:hypothetical protein